MNFDYSFVIIGISFLIVAIAMQFALTAANKGKDAIIKAAENI